MKLDQDIEESNQRFIDDSRQQQQVSLNVIVFNLDILAPSLFHLVVEFLKHWYLLLEHCTYLFLNLGMLICIGRSYYTCILPPHDRRKYGTNCYF